MNETQTTTTTNPDNLGKPEPRSLSEIAQEIRKGVEFSVKIESVGMNQLEPRFRPVITSKAATVNLCTYCNQDDAMDAALEYLKQEWKRRDYGKLFPGEAALVGTMKGAL